MKSHLSRGNGGFLPHFLLHLSEEGTTALATSVQKLARGGYAEIEIYNMGGRIVGTIAKFVAAGEPAVDLSQEPLSKGSYLVRVKIDGKYISKGIFKK